MCEWTDTTFSELEANGIVIKLFLSSVVVVDVGGVVVLVVVTVFMKTMKPKVNADKDTLDVGILLFGSVCVVVFLYLLRLS